MVWGYGQARAGCKGSGGAQGRSSRVGDLRQLHARATAGVVLVESAATPGAWRTHNARPFRDGVVPTPPSMIVSEVASLVDRYGHRPAESARAFSGWRRSQERLDRIRPFASAGGRVARLAVNLLLTRMGLPFMTIPRGISRVPRGDRPRRRRRSVSPSPVHRAQRRAQSRPLRAAGRSALARRAGRADLERGVTESGVARAVASRLRRCAPL